MRIFTRAAACAAMGFFVFSCTWGAPTNETGGGGGSGGDAAIAIVDRFCNILAKPECEADYACCMAPTRRNSGGVDSCVYWFHAWDVAICSHDWPDRARLIEAVRAGRVVFDEARFNTCLAVLKSMAGGGASCVELPLDVLATTCYAAFQGRAEPGDPCFSANNDVEGLHDQRALHCKDSRCEDGRCVPFLKVGDACDTVINNNDTSGSPATMLCNFPDDEVCWGPFDISTDAAAAMPQPGVCRPQAELGAACDPRNDRECRSGNCDLTGVCVLREQGGGEHCTGG